LYKKILLTGVNGQVGHSLHQAFLTDMSLSAELVSLNRSQLDLTDTDAIRLVVRDVMPDLIINPAAYTAVDKAETEPELAYAINATAPQVLAEEAARIGAKVIHFSTDYVYSGNKTGTYTEDDNTQPLSVYGKSKLAGEEAIRQVGVQHLIFRTSWVYDAYGKNFMKTILRLATERDELNIVSDQTGAPTSSHSISNAVLTVMRSWQHEHAGIYHLVNAGCTTWHGFARAIVEEYNNIQSARGSQVLKVSPQKIYPISTIEYPTPAVRPTNSTLDCAKLKKDFSVTLPHWREALIAELKLLE
jgi:dTDP-4-dehydrorhamnose reductase